MIKIEQNQILEKELHPCQYCGKTCKGKQCKECHLKMIKNRQGNCMDCNNLFLAVRLDGTKKKRCLECQKEYNNKYISNCYLCGNDYHAFLEDGRVFDKCYDCYKKTILECVICKEKTINNYNYCRSCYNENKNNLLSLNDDKKSIKSDNTSVSNDSNSPTKIRILHLCKTADCLNRTLNEYCKSCIEK
jgi:hypothetical protein